MGEVGSCEIGMEVDDRGIEEREGESIFEWWSYIASGQRKYCERMSHQAFVVRAG